MPKPRRSYVGQRNEISFTLTPGYLPPPLPPEPIAQWIPEYDNDWRQEPGLPVDLLTHGTPYIDRFGIQHVNGLGAPSGTTWEINATDGMRFVSGAGPNASNGFVDPLQEMVELAGGPAYDLLDRLWLVWQWDGLSFPVDNNQIFNQYNTGVYAHQPRRGRYSGTDGVEVFLLDADGGNTSTPKAQAGTSIIIGLEVSAYSVLARYGTGAWPTVPTDLPNSFSASGTFDWTLDKVFDSTTGTISLAAMALLSNFFQGAGGGAVTANLKRQAVYRWRTPLT